MKLNSIFFTIALIMLFGCVSDSNETEPASQITLNFNHYWDEHRITNTDLNSLSFINEFGNLLSIERLRYLISGIVLTKEDGRIIEIQGYNLTDISNETSLTYIPEELVEHGYYSNISFIFGFTNQNNTDGSYIDLNSKSWNVPSMLGGGYHFMQMDGKFLNNENQEQGYNYHAIRAANSPDNTVSQDTFFKVDLGAFNATIDTEINISVNIAEWFKNPNIWDLNELNQMLMPNYEAQIMMYENGQDVFSLIIND